MEGWSTVRGGKHHQQEENRRGKGIDVVEVRGSAGQSSLGRGLWKKKAGCIAAWTE